MRIDKKFAIPILTMLMISAIGITIAQFTLPIPNTGLIVSPGLTATPSSISWGELLNGSTNHQPVDIKNTNSISENISMTTDPLIDMSLSWDYNNTALAPGEVRTIIFTLTIAPNAEARSFEFNIYIYVA